MATQTRSLQHDAPCPTLKQQVGALEIRLIKDAIKRHRWNRGRAAAELGLSRVGLANKLKRYGLNRGEWQ